LKLLAVGEVLWDVFPDGERLGGAPFNLAAHARRLGHEVYFVSAVGEDERGQRALAEMERLGLSTDFVMAFPGYPTGTVTVELDAAGQPAFQIHRPAAYEFADLSGRHLARLVAWEPDWIAYGTLHQSSAGGRALTRRLCELIEGARRFYDVNLRPGCYTAELVEELLRSSHVVKLNAEEARALQRMLGIAGGEIEEFCRAALQAYGWEVLCVTLGAEGCVLARGDELVRAPAYPVEVVDTVGAGDAFAAALLHGLSAGWPLLQVADFANRVGALVASRPGAIPFWTVEEVESLSRAR